MDIGTSSAEDRLAKEIIQALANGAKQYLKVPLCECTVDNNLLYVYSLLYIPNNENMYRKMIYAHNDHPAAGHPEQAATYELVNRTSCWPAMRKTIARYLSKCDTCSRIKPVCHAPYGLLKHKQIPVTCCSSVSINFITGLPESGTNKFNSILIVVDRLTKMAHYIPTYETVTCKQVARLYLDKIFHLYGLSDFIVSNRGTQFISTFSRTLCKLVAISHNLSTSFHPQTDGQIERVNAILEQYLQGYIHYQQINRTEILTMAKFAYNNTILSTTKITPFFALYE